ncbi:hypothetical protein HNQ07_000886 [Deinococcus metalli]|uniref:HTH HARE-type domain-containing protein n=1 Tax=Deinococcus metalli TaxID=1141878 RepID=A0A7W8NQU6_9DEIO|nr:hypothetical protein [Deinococcus metalli]MBB5375442.1 hypothetical protein [Deinococcus metalli]
MTCRDDILAAIPVLIQARDDQTFSAVEVAKFMRARGTPYKELSIRRMVTYDMCAPEPDLTGRRTQELERVERGRYRVRTAQECRS